jgi:hypothetical protein
MKVQPGLWQRNPGLAAYVGISALLCGALLLDQLYGPLFPGLGGPTCSIKGGGWQIGTVSGPSPLELQISNNSVLSCASIANVTASHVAYPFLLVPPADAGEWGHAKGGHASSCADSEPFPHEFPHTQADSQPHSGMRSTRSRMQ